MCGHSIKYFCEFFRYFLERNCDFVDVIYKEGIEKGLLFKEKK